MPAAHATVSVIIPAHNAEPYLRETIECVRGQTWPRKEIILVDDKSTDATRAVAEELDVPEMKVVTTPPDRSGASAARNVGLENAAGDYVQYLDADDLLSREKIEAQIRLLETQPADYVASCRWGKFKESPADATMEELPVFADFSPLEWLLTSWKGGGMMAIHSWLIPMGVVRNAGTWDEELTRNPADDGEYMCRVLLQSRGIAFCDTTAAYYRVPEAGHVSSNVSEEAVRALFMNCERYRQHALKVENSARVRHALMVNYARFIYRFHPAYRELVACARRRIRELGFERIPGNAVGGARFRRLAALVGFETALRMRNLFSKACG